MFDTFSQALLYSFISLMNTTDQEILRFGMLELDSTFLLTLPKQRTNRQTNYKCDLVI